MQTLLSGLSEQASRAYAGAPVDGAFSMEWQTASLFITEAEIASVSEARQWVWLYRAPWAWLAEGNNVDVTAALQQWQAEQRAVLQLRRTLRQRLIMVNVDRVASQSLAERLGFSCAGEQSAAGAASPLASTLAGVFEQMDPECWTLYEALEAAAWLPVGEPEFRSNRVLPANEGLVELLELIHAGRQFPSVNQALNEREQAISGLSQEMQSARTMAQSSQDERELLLGQLHQVQEALESRHLESLSLQDQHTAVKQELAQTIAAHQQATEETVAARAGTQSLFKENELLLSQLHQVQEELEKRYLESLSFNEQSTALKQQLAQTIASQQQALKQADAAQSDTQSLTEENGLLLAQLHQVQEALEMRHLDKLSLEGQFAALKQELAQVIASQESAKQSESDLSAQHNYKDESELLLAQLHQVQEELEKRHLQSLTFTEQYATLKQELAQTIAAQQQSNQERDGAQAMSNSLIEENELLLSQLHLVQEELENYYLANREILAAMSQSNDTLHRARKVISRMAAHV
ncbi:hypothetical protein [Pseudomonas putida]